MGCAPSSAKTTINKPVHDKGIIAPQEQQQLLAMEKEIKADLAKLDTPGAKDKNNNKKLHKTHPKRKKSHSSSSSSSSSDDDDIKNITLINVEPQTTHAGVTIPIGISDNVVPEEPDVDHLVESNHEETLDQQNLEINHKPEEVDETNHEPVDVNINETDLSIAPEVEVMINRSSLGGDNSGEIVEIVTTDSNLEIEVSPSAVNNTDDIGDVTEVSLEETTQEDIQEITISAVGEEEQGDIIQDPVVVGSDNEQTNAVDEPIQLIDEPTQPIDEATEHIEELTLPVDEITEPINELIESGDVLTEPVKEPSLSICELTEPAVEPTEPSDEPVEIEESPQNPVESQEEDAEVLTET